MATGSLPPELLELTFGFCHDLRRLHAFACVCKAGQSGVAVPQPLRRLTYNGGHGELVAGPTSSTTLM